MVGTLFTTTGFAEQKNEPQEGTVKCYGANACKGHSACNMANNHCHGMQQHSCRGMNNCKGMGFIMTNTEKECLDMGGHIEVK